MSDPFAQPLEYRKVMREAKIGALLLVMLAGFFAYVVFYRVERFKSQLPQYVLDAPVAKIVEPSEYFRSLEAGATGAKPAPVQQQASATPNPASPPRVASATVPEKLEIVLPKTVKRPSIYQNELRGHQPDSKVVTASANEPIVEVPALTRPAKRESQSHQNFDVRPQAAIPHPTVTKPQKIERKKKQTPLAPIISRTESPIKKTADNSFQPIAVTLPEPDDFTSTQNRNDALEPAKVVPKELASKFAEDFTPLQPATDRPAQIEPKVDNDLSATFEGQPIPELSIEEPAHESFDTTPSINVKSEPAFAVSDVSTIDTNDNTFVSAVEKTNPLKTYTVRSGDSYWAIAQTVYGDGRFFRALFQHNQAQQGNFESLEPGTELSTPTPDILLIKYPELCPAELQGKTESTGSDSSESVYQTSDGDTLFDIARSKLGQASRYLEILELNQDILPKNITHMAVLKSGIELKLPH